MLARLAQKLASPSGDPEIYCRTIFALEGLPILDKKGDGSRGRENSGGLRRSLIRFDGLRSSLRFNGICPEIVPRCPKDLKTTFHSFLLKNSTQKFLLTKAKHS